MYQFSWRPEKLFFLIRKAVLSAIALRIDIFTYRNGDNLLRRAAYRQAEQQMTVIYCATLNYVTTELAQQASEMSSCQANRRTTENYRPILYIHDYELGRICSFRRCAITCKIVIGNTTASRQQKQIYHCRELAGYFVKCNIIDSSDSKSELWWLPGLSELFCAALCTNHSHKHIHEQLL